MRRKIDLVRHLNMNKQLLNFSIEYSTSFNVRQAAIASGFDPDEGYKLFKLEAVQEALNIILADRWEAADITAEWHLMELVDNHNLARQEGNISASNTALREIGKHKMVDANAREKVDVNVTTSQDIIDRLNRGRMRNSNRDLVVPAEDNTEELKSDTTEGVSFL